MAGRAWRARLLAPLGPWAVSLLVAGVVVAAAVAAPVKYVDEHRVLLDAGCTSVKQVASAMGARLGEGAELEGEVCFDAPNPTQRRVTSALGERGIGVKQYQCGTGATLLFGTHPIGPPVLFTKPP